MYNELHEIVAWTANNIVLFVRTRIAQCRIHASTSKLSLQINAVAVVGEESAAIKSLERKKGSNQAQRTNSKRKRSRKKTLPTFRPCLNRDAILQGLHSIVSGHAHRNQISQNNNWCRKLWSLYYYYDTKYFAHTIT